MVSSRDLFVPERTPSRGLGFKGRY